jgi:hypothetical protein
MSDLASFLAAIEDDTLRRMVSDLDEFSQATTIAIESHDWGELVLTSAHVRAEYARRFHA